MKFIDLFNILKLCVSENLFIQGKDNIIWSPTENIAKSVRLNFLFEKEIFSGPDMSAARDLNTIIDDGKIYQNWSGPKYAESMIDVMLVDGMNYECDYIHRLLEESLAARICVQQGCTDILKSRNSLSQHAHQEWEGNIKEVTQYVKANHSEILAKSMLELHESLCRESYKCFGLDLSKTQNCAVLLTYLIAEILSELVIPIDDSDAVKGANSSNNSNENENRKNKIVGKSARIRIEEKILKLKDAKSIFLSLNEKKATEELLSQLYYDTYGFLTDVKDRNNTRRVSERLYSKFEEAFQLPSITSTSGKKWSINFLSNKKNIIWAPNGYGKTTLLKSILFASSYCYRNINQTDKKFYEETRKFHDIGEGYFAVYIEATYYSFVNTVEGIDWIYDISCKQMGIDKSTLSSDEYFSLLRKKNAENKLIVIVDGYDELNDELRSEFVERINAFSESKQYGNNAIIIMSSRPYFDMVLFNGYMYWSIEPLSFEKNEKFIKKFIEAYTGSEKGVYAKDLFNLINNNHFLREAIITPEILIDIICVGMQYLKINERYDIHDIVEETIEDLIQRIDPLHPKTVTNYGTIDDVKSIYSLLAINILTLRNGIKEGNFSEILRNIIEQLCEEENESRYKHRKIRRILELDDDEIVRLFFTKMSILKSDGKYVQFLSDTFSKHLAAQRLIAELETEDLVENSWLRLVQMRDLKYEVFTMICTLAYYVENITLQDVIVPKIESVFSRLLSFDDKNEIEELQLMLIDILQKNYGENIMYNRKNIVSKVIIDNIETVKRILMEDTKQDIRDRKICLDILEKAV